MILDRVMTNIWACSVTRRYRRAHFSSGRWFWDALFFGAGMYFKIGRIYGRKRRIISQVWRELEAREVSH